MNRWDAVDYAKNSQGQFDWALATIERLDLADDSYVLDIGCGDGKVSAEIARRVPSGRVIGIDNSLAMIDLAKCTWKTVANLDFRLMDAQAINLPCMFDLAFSNSTLHWVPDHPAVLKGVAAVLKAGGRLNFSMGGRGTAAVVYEAIGHLIRIKRWAAFLSGVSSPHHFFGPEEYGRWLPDAGFRPVHVALTPKPMRHTTSEALAGWLRTVWTPYTNCIPPSQRDTFLAELLILVRAGCDEVDNGVLLLPMVNLEVEAEKIAV